MAEQPPFAMAFNSQNREGVPILQRTRRYTPSIDDRLVTENEAPQPQLTSALVVGGVRLFAETLQREVRRIFPEIVTTYASNLATANEALLIDSVDLILVLLDTLQGDAFELLAKHHGESHQGGRVVVVTARHDPKTLTLLRSLSIEGVVDLRTDGLTDFAVALRTVVRGKHYWSKALVDDCRVAVQPAAFLRMLTPVEQLVLGVVGDGCDDKTAAEKLGMRPSSVQSVRRELHRKLCVQRQPDLMRRAIELGAVYFSSEGRVVRPGFSLMLAQARLHGRGAQVRQCAGNCGGSVPCKQCPASLG